MRLLLLNNNPAVSRLIKLSVDKVGYELDEFEDYGIVPLNHYDLIMVDNECYDEAELETLCEQSHCQYVLYICQRGSKKPEFANMALEKPFLPTDFLTLLEKIKNVLASLKPEESKSVEEEIDLSEDEPEVALQNVAAFDIDGIDPFGVEEEAPLQSDIASEKEELLNEEDISMDMPEMQEEDDTLDLPTFDLDVHEEDLTMPFMRKEVNDENSEDDDIFISEETIAMNASSPEAEEKIEEAFNATSILDKDEINEVKQLLDESEEESLDLESAFEVSGAEPLDEDAVEEDNSDLLFQETALRIEDGDDEKEFALDDIFTQNALEDNKEELSFEEIDEDSLEAEDVGLEEEELIIPTQEEMIDDFEEDIEEKIEEELEMAMDDEIAVLSQVHSSDFDSLDDLNENAIKRAFGEEVEESQETPMKKDEDVAIIRGEIENTIARSLSGLAQSDILREALKGMRINISITFDEKN